ncbi:MAG: hypothetical protein V7647_957 [Acidobacteriota bacterium]|jgi:hypothetical protein
MAATSVPQFAVALALEAAPCDVLALADASCGAALDVARVSAAMCRFNSDSCAFAGPLTDPAGIASSAALACCRWASGDDWSAWVEADVGVAVEVVGSAVVGLVVGCGLGGSAAGCGVG